MCIVRSSNKQRLEDEKYIYASDFIELIAFHTKANIKIERIAAYLIDENFDQHVTSYLLHRKNGSYIKDLHRESFGYDLNTRNFLTQCDNIKYATSKYFLYSHDNDLDDSFLYLIDELKSIECIKNLNIDFDSSVMFQVDEASRKWNDEIEKPIFKVLGEEFNNPELRYDFLLHLIKRDSFSIMQAACLVAGNSTFEIEKYQNHFRFTEVFADYISYRLMLELAVKNDELQLTNGFILSLDLQKYLFENGYIINGFNDWLTIEPAKPLILNKSNEQLEASNNELKEAQAKIKELENKLSQAQEAKPKVAVIPFGKRIDFISKDLPQSERIKRSYELCSDNISFYEDTHPVNTPDEMIKRIQGLLKVIRDKDSKISELEKQTNTSNNAQGKIDELENQLAQAKAELLNKPANDDRELNTKSQNYAAKIVLAMAQVADLDLNSPYACKEPNTTNSNIFDQIKTNGMKVSNQVIGNWLKLATEQTKDD